MTDTSSADATIARVLIIVENLPVPFDRRVWQEATALRKAGYGVAVICPKGKGHVKSYEELAGVHIYRHKLPADRAGALGYFLEYGVALFWHFVLSARIRRRHGFDVIHACNPPDLIFIVAAFWKTLFGTKFVYDQHDLCPELYTVKFGRRDWLYRLLLRFERLTYRLADVALATNETLREQAVSRGGIARERVWIVRSYPDLEKFRPVPAHIERRRGFPYLVGYVGIMAEQDGVDLLVRAMAEIVHEKRRTDIGCAIIGDGPQLAALRTLAAELKVDGQVRFEGYLAGEDLLGAIAACDIGVIPDPPNGCNEKLSMNKVFEYMAAGLPFVQFDLPQSSREAGAAAHIVAEPSPSALADGIIELIGDEARRKRMGDYGRLRAQRDFRWETEAESLVAAYSAALPGDPAPAPVRGAAL